MKKRVNKRKTTTRVILLTIVGIFFFIFVILPLVLTFFDGSKLGNVAIIPIVGVITANGGKVFGGEETASSREITVFIEEAEKNSHVEAIVLEINSPGGSAVASDEIAAAVKKSKKPVIALIREIGASGGYWVASAADHIVANRMSITGSIGVISSYLEFSGLMADYNVTYQRMVAGDLKDLGTPYRPLQNEERNILQGKLNKIHDFFIQEVAENRGLEESAVREVATGEFYLGIEAINFGLVDQLGDLETVKKYLLDIYQITSFQPIVYQKEISLLELLSKVFSEFSFQLGKGLASLTLKEEQKILLI